MSQTRALFASIGASVSLVVAAALSLLAVSAVFAFGGWSDPVVGSVKQTAITLPVGGATGTGHEAAVVLPARKARPVHHAAAPRPRRHAQPKREAPVVAVPQPAVTSRPAPVVLPPQVIAGTEAVAPPAPVAAPRKSVGDRVRTAGDDITSTVDDVGTAVANVTQPLLPPVSSAVQKLTNIIVTLLRRAGDDVGGLLNRLLPVR
jgi:hypothetical protein